MKQIYCFLFLFLLNGCGGGESSSSGSGGNNENTDGGNVQSQSFNTQDIIKFSYPGRELRLPLNDYIELSSSSSNLRLKELTPILNESSQRYCENYTADELNLSFYSSTDDVGECVYQYTVEADGATSEPALIRVVFSDQETGLVRISETTSIGQTIAINLGSAIPEGFYIDKSSFIVLGSGTVQTSEFDTHIINYTAGEFAGDAGISRILLNLRKEESDTVIAVTIDVAVSEDSINHAPLAFNFRYGDLGTFYPGRQLDYINVPLGETATIDIAPYFNKGYIDSNDNKIEMKNSKGEYFYDDAGNKINFYMDVDGSTTTDTYRSGLYLIDPDKHPVQLIDVYSYNAVVGPIQSVGEFTSTMFSFKSNVQGLNYVTYVLSDHNGGYATGIVAINVGTPVPWKAQLRAAKNTFLAPLEYGLVLQQNINHAGASNEDGVNGPIGFSTALYTYNQALALCASYGLDLPTASDIAGLKVDFPAGLYASLDKYAIDINARKEKISWPASSYYWSKSSTADAATVYSLADYNNRSVSTANEDERFAVTCVAKGTIGSVTVEKNNAYRLPYDLQDGAVVRVKVVDNQGSPIAGIKVMSIVDKYTLSNAINNGVTDSNGDVRFNISSILARDATPLRFTVGLSSVSNNQVRFLDLPRYVRTGEWRNSVEKPYATLCFYDTIELMARGDCTKASVKRNELWWGASYDSYFVDSFYVYRIQSENLFRTRSFSGAANPLVMPASEKYGVYTFTRPDPYRSFNPVLYDLKYYWVVNEAKKRVEAYEKIDDMSRQVNIKMAFNMVGSVNLAFVYDQVSGLYWRTTGVWTNNFDKLRSYKTIEDAAQMTNYIDEVPFYNLGGNNTTSQHKFAIFN